MTERKHQNSILVLATLGVYLGLVLAGATPQILAQAATTRLFDVKDEIEVRDDLDKKPDPTQEQLNDAFEAYTERVEDFVKNLRKLHSIENFSSDWDTFESERTTFSPCPETGTLQGKESSSNLDRWLVPVVEEANFISEHFTWLADCLRYEGIHNRTQAASAGIKLSYDKSELKHELSIKFANAERAKSRHSGLLAAYAEFKLDEEDADYELQKVLLKNTSLTISGDQVFIVTRLARSDLDALLATNAK